MYLKKLHPILVAGLLVPAGVDAQSSDGFTTENEWRNHFHELCLTGEAGLQATSSMFGIAVRLGADSSREYCDCFADEAMAFYKERGIGLGMGSRFRNASRSGDRVCFAPFDDGSPRFDVRTVSHDQRQAILESVAAP